MKRVGPQGKPDSEPSQRARSKKPLYVVLLWLAVLVGFWTYANASGKPLTVFLSEVLDTLQGDPLAPLILLVIYLVRPLLLLPVSLLTVAAGVLFGAVWGVLYAIVANLLTAGVTYWLGRLFGRDLRAAAHLRWLDRLKTYPFETVLLCRFLAVPGDLVNYASGYLKVSFAAFLGATAIGGSPGLLIGVFAGASLSSLAERSAHFRLDWRYLLASALLLAVSLGVSWLLRRRSSLKV